MKGRDTYRHGDVRAEAAAAAVELARRGGPKAVTLRAVAGKVGVAHRSLYNHFDGREALLDAVAEQYFVRRAQALKDVATPAAFVAAYVRFALSEPHLYAIGASRPHHTMPGKRPLHEAAHLSTPTAVRLFGDPAASSEEKRWAVMKVLILLHGAISWRLAGVLDVEDDEALIARLQAMVAAS